MEATALLQRSLRGAENWLERLWSIRRAKSRGPTLDPASCGSKISLSVVEYTSAPSPIRRGPGFEILLLAGRAKGQSGHTSDIVFYATDEESYSRV